MIRFIYIAILVGLNTWTFGQTTGENSRVLQMCIDLDELQSFYHIDEAGGRKPLIISDDGVVPAQLNITKFGEPVQFIPKKELFFYDEKAFLDFEKFEISSTHADIKFHYVIEGVTVLLTLEKVEGNWKIMTKKLIEK